MNGHLRRWRCASAPHVQPSTLRCGRSRRLASGWLLNRLRLLRNRERINGLVGDLGTSFEHLRSLVAKWLVWRGRFRSWELRRAA